MKSKLFIIAYNKKQADDYARSAGLKKNEYIYVSNTNSLRGMRGPISFIKIRNWYERIDIDEITRDLDILKAVEVKGFKVIEACRYLSFLNKDNAEILLSENEVISWFKDGSYNDSPALIKYCHKNGILISPECCSTQQNAMCDSFEKVIFSIPIKPIIK